MEKTYIAGFFVQSLSRKKKLFLNIKGEWQEGQEETAPQFVDITLCGIDDFLNSRKIGQCLVHMVTRENPTGKVSPIISFRRIRSRHYAPHERRSA